MASAMKLLGRSSLASPAAAAPGRERRGGPCFAAVGREGSAHRRRSSLRSTAPVGALAERVVVTPAPPERAGAGPPEPHPQSVAARAVVTVRRRRKEDAKRRVAEQLDAYADRVGRSVLLELISTETDPSKKQFRDSTIPVAARHAMAWNSKTHPALRCIFELYWQ
jgi:lipoxygenase